MRATKSAAEPSDGCRGSCTSDQHRAAGLHEASETAIHVLVPIYSYMIRRIHNILYLYHI